MIFVNISRTCILVWQSWIRWQSSVALCLVPC